MGLFLNLCLPLLSFLITYSQSPLARMYGVRAATSAIGRGFSASSVALGSRSTAAAAVSASKHSSCLAKPSNDGQYSSANLKVSSVALGMCSFVL